MKIEPKVYLFETGDVVYSTYIHMCVAVLLVGGIWKAICGKTFTDKQIEAWLESGRYKYMGNVTKDAK